MLTPSSQTQTLEMAKKLWGWAENELRGTDLLWQLDMKISKEGRDGRSNVMLAKKKIFCHPFLFSENAITAQLHWYSHRKCIFRDLTWTSHDLNWLLFSLMSLSRRHHQVWISNLKIIEVWIHHFSYPKVLVIRLWTPKSILLIGSRYIPWTHPKLQNHLSLNIPTPRTDSKLKKLFLALHSSFDLLRLQWSWIFFEV